ncbi:MAG: hypothetical protein Q8P79_01855 [Nanoarchaeota archaeon]|nr:hypothetical protein [Nanoarchaeota archaeon]
MKHWINQVYIGLMTGLLGGIASGYIIANYVTDGLTFWLILETIILTTIIGLLVIGLYILIFERKIFIKEKRN